MPDLMPWGAMELSKLKDDMDRLFNALCEDFGLARESFPEGSVRVTQADGEWVVTCSLPGFSPQDVAVTVTGRVLSITAVRSEGAGGGVVRLARELTLPVPVDKVLAGMEGQVLTVRLSRAEKPSPRAIPVSGTGGEACGQPCKEEPAGEAETHRSPR